MEKMRSMFEKVTAYAMGAFAALMYAPKALLAQDWMPIIGPEQDSLAEVIRTLLNTAIIFAGVVAVAFLIFNGFKYMTAAGDTAKTEEAQKGIANALIGLVIAIIAGLIVNFVLGLFGMDPGSIE